MRRGRALCNESCIVLKSRGSWWFLVQVLDVFFLGCCSTDYCSLAAYPPICPPSGRRIGMTVTDSFSKHQPST